MKTGHVLSIKAGAIREQDTYKFLEGVNEDFQFTRNLSPNVSNPNQIIAAYCVIKMKENPREDFILKVMPIRPNDLNTNYMDVESAAKYVAQRAAMREVIHTKLHAFEGVAELVEMLAVERESYQMEDSEEVTEQIEPVKAEPEITAAESSPDTSRNDPTIESTSGDIEEGRERQSPFRLDYTEEELNGEEPERVCEAPAPPKQEPRRRRTI